MSTLAQLEVQLAALLMDTGNTIWSTGTLDAVIRQALADYSLASPCAREGLIVCPGASREIALDTLTNLNGVTDVQYPFDSTTEEWPPDLVSGWVLTWDDANPVLLLPEELGTQPQLDDEIRINYTTPHTIENLDSATVTTVPAGHEPYIVRGAAGYACRAKAVDLSHEISPNAWAVRNYTDQAEDYIKQFQRFLSGLSLSRSARTLPFAPGWSVD